VQYKSTFAPSKQAEQRRIKSQAQQAAHDAAVHRPGRSNGKKKGKDARAWDASSEEDDDEEEEDEEEEEDAAGGSSSNFKPVAVGSSQTSTSASISPTPPTIITATRGGPLFSSPSPVASTPDGTAYAAMKPIRHLPQIPGKPIGEFNLYVFFCYLSLLMPFNQ
jgi:CCR4-NOT transcriptional complex subunit CAF120